MSAPLLAPLLKTWIPLPALGEWPPALAPWPVAFSGKAALPWLNDAWFRDAAVEAEAFDAGWDDRAIETQLPSLEPIAEAARAEAAHDEFIGELPALSGLKAYRP